MTDNLVIALDGMGGDDAPRIVVEGAHLVRRRYPQAKFIIYGDEEKIRPLVEDHRGLSNIMEIRHTSQKIASDDAPGAALRNGRDSSMRLAIDAVAKGEAQAIVSAGNTGALMAMAKFSLKVLPGIRRPAIATFLPTKVPGHGCVVLDLGANVECDSEILLDFAVLGGVFSREILKVPTPRISLLNIGSEAMKGRDVIKEAAESFAAATHLPGEYVGFTEGDTMLNGQFDVVVTDGFTGNIALKTVEGTARLIGSMVKRAFHGSWMMKIGLFLCLPGIIVALPGLWALKKRIDPRYYNGASLMGLKGLCVKSHGGTDAVGFANAIGVAADMSLTDFNGKVAAALKQVDMVKENGE